MRVIAMHPISWRRQVLSLLVHNNRLARRDLDGHPTYAHPARQQAMLGALLLPVNSDCFHVSGKLGPPPNRGSIPIHKSRALLICERLYAGILPESADSILPFSPAESRAEASWTSDLAQSEGCDPQLRCSIGNQGN